MKTKLLYCNYYYFQLREDFDSGRDLHLTDEHSPHDVGGLLKEFFRDLPDPLLTRDLYSSFVATRSKSEVFGHVENKSFVMLLSSVENLVTSVEML